MRRLVGLCSIGIGRRTAQRGERLNAKGENMAIFGAILILVSLVAFLYNGYQLFQLRKFKRMIAKEAEGLDEGLAPFVEYNSSMLWVSLAAFPAGVYLVLSKNAGWSNIAGLLIGLYGISALIQSFRPYDTAAALTKAGRDLRALNSTLWTGRVLGAICIPVGIYLFVKSS